MVDDYAHVTAQLRDHGLLPEGVRSVFVSGSLVRGWGNPTSDLDVAVVSERRWESPNAVITHVALEPQTIPHECVFVDGQRWDIEYWLESQFAQMLDKVSRERFDKGERVWQSLSLDELSMLERLPYAVAAGDPGWLARCQRELAESAHRAVLVTRSLDHAGSYAEDAAGQCASGDLESAVLTARLAFDCAVDGLLAGAGQFGSCWPKWRARRFREANPEGLSFAEFWSVQTMRDFDPADPQKWVESVIALCRRIAMSVEV